MRIGSCGVEYPEIQAFSELFGVTLGADHTPEVTGSSPASPLQSAGRAREMRRPPATHLITLFTASSRRIASDFSVSDTRRGPDGRVLTEIRTRPADRGSCTPANRPLPGRSQPKFPWVTLAASACGWQRRRLNRRGWREPTLDVASATSDTGERQDAASLSKGR